MTGLAVEGASPGISTRVWGTRGPGLVLIHGWSCTGGVWDDLLPLLIPWFRVVTLDLPGHGASRPEAPLTIGGMAEAVAAALARLNIGPVVLVGHSMGGPVALETAILLGRACPMVIGVDTFTDAAFYARRPAAEIERRVEAFSTDFPATMAAMVRGITRSGSATLADDIARMMAASDPVTALSALRSLLDWDIAAHWPLATCSVETINSAPLTLGMAAVGGLDGLTVHLMDAVGHFPMRENPARVAELIREAAGRSRPAERSG